MAIKAAEREGKRHPLSLRVTAGVRRGLEEAASAAGRSLTQEAEYRLERTFADDRDGGAGQKLMLRAMSRTWTFLDAKLGEGWIDDPAGVAAMRHALMGVLEWGMPAEPVTPSEVAEVAIADADAVVDMITWRNGSPAFPGNKLMAAAGRQPNFIEVERAGTVGGDPQQKA